MVIGIAGCVHVAGFAAASDAEVEEVLYTHPAVLNAAVVAVSDEKWGEAVCAAVELKPQLVGSLTQDDVIKFCSPRDGRSYHRIGRHGACLRLRHHQTR